MIFLGDIAHPFEEPPVWASMAMPWSSQPVVVNLEGSLSNDAGVLQDRRLFNHPGVLPALKSCGVAVAALANNHVMDLPDNLAATTQELGRIGIKSMGAGRTFDDAAQSVIIDGGDCSTVLLNFGWQPIGCEPAIGESQGVNRLDPEHVLNSIQKTRQTSPGSRVIVVMHWNYEMELYPQPAHRQLAFACIDAGAEAVIGHHPHRVGGIEWRSGKLIAYSLGNFWLPQGVFFDGTLVFDDDASLQLALEWYPDKTCVAHWFQYNRDNHSLAHLSSEPLEESLELERRTPFSGMSDVEYLNWFRENRIKRKLLPVYRDYRHQARNRLKDAYIGWRHKALVLAENMGVRRILRF